MWRRSVNSLFTLSYPSDNPVPKTPLRRAVLVPYMLAFLFLYAVSSIAEVPNIGLIYTNEGLHTLEKEGRDTRQTYRDAIEEQGGRIVVLGQTHPPALVAARLSRIFPRSMSAT